MILVDADIVAFRAAFSAEDELEPWVACSRADCMLKEMSEALEITNLELWLSGKNNFRYNVFPEYKANRINAKRPKWEHEVKAFMVAEWGATYSEGCEADDMLGIRQFQLKPRFGDASVKREGSFHDKWEFGGESIIATIDKDLDMIPGWHYNFVKKEKYYITYEEAIRNFYYQLLVGDAADGVKGVAGIGPKKAKKLLDSCDEEAACNGVDAERLYYENVKDLFSCYEEFEMNAKCLWIWRQPNGVWTDKYQKEIGVDTST